MTLKYTTATLVVIFSLIVILLAGVSLLLYTNNNGRTVHSFEECKAAGYPILESHPERCMATDRTFVNEPQID